MALQYRVWLYQEVTRTNIKILEKFHNEKSSDIDLFCFNNLVKLLKFELDFLIEIDRNDLEHYQSNQSYSQLLQLLPQLLFDFNKHLSNLETLQRYQQNKPLSGQTIFFAKTSAYKLRSLLQESLQLIEPKIIQVSAPEDPQFPENN